MFAQKEMQLMQKKAPTLGQQLLLAIQEHDGVLFDTTEEAESYMTSQTRQQLSFEKSRQLSLSVQKAQHGRFAKQEESVQQNNIRTK